MCNPKVSTNGSDMNMVCETSGKPITNSNQYGMYCDDNCTLKEDKAAMRFLSQLIGGTFPPGFPK